MVYTQNVKINQLILLTALYLFSHVFVSLQFLFFSLIILKSCNIILHLFYLCTYIYIHVCMYMCIYICVCVCATKLFQYEELLITVNKSQNVGFVHCCFLLHVTQSFAYLIVTVVSSMSVS